MQIRIMNRKSVLLCILPFLLIVSGCSTRSLNVNSFYVALQGIDINKLSHLPYELIIIDYSFDGTEARELKDKDLDKLKECGKQVFSYLSIGEAEDYRFYWKDSYRENPPRWLLEENPDWPGNYKVAYWDDEWQEIIFNYIDRIVKAGFNGIFFDRVDVYKEFASEDSSKNYQKLMINFLRNIIKRLSDKGLYSFKLIVNNSEELLFKDYAVFRNISGLLAESLYTDGAGNIREEKEIKIRENSLRSLRLLGKCVMVVEYSVGEKDKPIIKARAEKKKFLIQFLEPSLSL